MVGRRSSTIVVALVACLAIVGALRLGLGPVAESAPAPAQLSADDRPPLVEPDLLALADDLHQRPSRPPVHRPPPAPRGFEHGPRMCMVVARCPSEPCVQFVERDRRGGPPCDRFPDPGDARMLPIRP